MKAAPIKTKPGFTLLKMTDVFSFYHIQTPQWFFADPKYRSLSSDAKLAYSLLLSRHQLSKMNNWINEDGEVFIIYTRQELAKTLGISDRKAIQCMQELNRARLIWERRCGRGEANQIYLAKVELSDEHARTYQNAPFVDSGIPAEEASRAADSACLEWGKQPDDADAAMPYAQTRPAKIAVQEDAPPAKTCENGSSGHVESAVQDLQKSHPNYTDLRKKEYSQSVCQDMEDLQGILDKCSLWAFSPQTAKVFEGAIERLYYSESFKVSGAVLPRDRVRARLRELDDIILREAEHKIAANTGQQIKNSTAYVMAVVFNAITEVESDIMSDPYLNSLDKRAPPGKGG